MIPPLLFPAFAPLVADRTQNLIAGLWRRFTMAVLLDLGVFAQGDDRFNRLLVRRIGQPCVPILNETLCRFKLV